MVTSIDKALVALIMSVIYILNTYYGFHLGVSEEMLNMIVSVFTPFLVYLVPNKKRNGEQQ